MKSEKNFTDVQFHLLLLPVFYLLLVDRCTNWVYALPKQCFLKFIHRAQRNICYERFIFVSIFSFFFRLIKQILENLYLLLFCFRNEFSCIIYIHLTVNCFTFTCICYHKVNQAGIIFTQIFCGLIVPYQHAKSSILFVA